MDLRAISQDVIHDKYRGPPSKRHNDPIEASPGIGSWDHVADYMGYCYHLCQFVFIRIILLFYKNIVNFQLLGQVLFLFFAHSNFML